MDIIKNGLLLILAIWSIVQIYIGVYERIVRLEEQAKSAESHFAELKDSINEINASIRELRADIKDLEYSAIYLRQSIDKKNKNK